MLMDRLADKRDPLLLKIVRNIAQWTFNQQEVKLCYVVFCNFMSIMDFYV